MTRIARFFVVTTFLFATLCTFSQSSHADILWDTGPASGDIDGSGIYPFGYYLTGGEYSQYAAGLLSLSDTYTITNIEGWMATDGSYSGGSLNQSGGNMTVAIYGNGSDGMPGELIARSDPFLIADGSTPNWYGASNLNFVLDPGSYWFSFEAVDDTFSAQMPTLQWLNNLGNYSSGMWPPNPMQSYAFFYGNDWNSYGGMYGSAVGMHIEGTLNSGQTPVPEPSTFLLLGAGLAGLAFLKQKRTV